MTLDKLLRWKDAKFLARMARSAGVCDREIYESIDFCNRIHRITRGKKVLELGCGHGLVGRFLVLRNWCKWVYQIDERLTRANTSLPGFCNQHGRVYFEYLDIYDHQDEILALDFEVLVGVHLCGDLTDEALSIAIEKGADVAVCPCCYHKTKRRARSILHEYGRGGMDAARLYHLSSSGYDTRVKHLDSRISPRNTILVGVEK